MPTHNYVHNMSKHCWVQSVGGLLPLWVAGWSRQNSRSIHCHSESHTSATELFQPCAPLWSLLRRNESRGMTIHFHSHAQPRPLNLLWILVPQPLVRACPLHFIQAGCCQLEEVNGDHSYVFELSVIVHARRWGHNYCYTAERLMTCLLTVSILPCTTLNSHILEPHRIPHAEPFQVIPLSLIHPQHGNPYA